MKYHQRSKLLIIIIICRNIGFFDYFLKMSLTREFESFVADKAIAQYLTAEYSVFLSEKERRR